MHRPRSGDGFEGPAQLETRQAAPMRLEWQALTAKVNYARPVPRHIALEWRDLNLFLDDSAADAPSARVDSVHVEVAPKGPDVEVVGSFEGGEIAAALSRVKALPPLSGKADISLTDGVARIASRKSGLRGTAGVIHDFTVNAGGDAGISVSGPVSIDGDGLVDATLSLTLHDPAELSRLLGAALPAYREQISSVLSSLAALGDEPSIPVRIAHGRIWLGFIPLGSIPAL